MTLLSARQVQELLDIDKSTVYRMAGDGRLPAVKVGRQWRFPEAGIHGLLRASVPRLPDAATAHTVIDAVHAAAVIDLTADLLGVMMVVTDLEGRPITDVANPCPRFVEMASDPEAVAACSVEWRDLADDRESGPHFRQSALGFLCARSFVRAADRPIAMVLAGGVAPPDVNADDLFHLDGDGRRRVAAVLPRVAGILSTQMALLTAWSVQ